MQYTTEDVLIEGDIQLCEKAVRDVCIADGRITRFEFDTIIQERIDEDILMRVGKQNLVTDVLHGNRQSENEKKINADLVARFESGGRLTGKQRESLIKKGCHSIRNKFRSFLLYNRGKSRLDGTWVLKESCKHYTCTKCKNSLPETDFAKDKGKKNGLCSQCKKCRSVLNRKTRKQKALDAVSP